MTSRDVTLKTTGRPRGRWISLADVVWDSEIIVPFAPEAPASGIGESGFMRACWYRRSFQVSRLAANERLLLHFGAVDHHAFVWVNGTQVGEHEGGYTPFSFDVTPQVSADGAQELVATTRPI